MIRSQRQINICQHGQSCIFAGTSHVLVVVRRLGRKQVNRIFTIGNYLSISLFDCSACNVCRFSRIIRSQTQWNTTVQTYQYIVIMCTEKISLSQTAVLDSLWHGFSLQKTIQHNVALSYPHPGRTPHVQCHAIVALRYEVRSLYRFKAVGTATGTHQTVTRHNIQCPDTLVVHIGRLKGAIAGIGQSNGHIIGHRRFRVNRIFRRLVQKVVAGSQQQYCQHI